MATSKLYVDPSYIARAEEDEFALYVYVLTPLIPFHDRTTFSFSSAFARIENHYFINDVSLGSPLIPCGVIRIALFAIYLYIGMDEGRSAA